MTIFPPFYIPALPDPSPSPSPPHISETPLNKLLVPPPEDQTQDKMRGVTLVEPPSIGLPCTERERERPSHKVQFIPRAHPPLCPTQQELWAFLFPLLSPSSCTPEVSPLTWDSSSLPCLETALVFILLCLSSEFYALILQM